MKKIAYSLLTAIIALAPLSGVYALTVGGTVNVGADSNGSYGNSSSSVNVNTGVDITVGGSNTGDTDVSTGENTEASFTSYGEEVKEKNENVKSVAVDADGAVDVQYAHRGWLFGFIPITVTSHTTVVADDTGSVQAKVRMPWWSFLVSGVAKVRSNTEAALQTNATVKANASAQGSLDSRVKLTEVIVSSLEVATEADASATTEVSGSN